MKKQLLFGMALIAGLFTVNAQGTYAVTSGETITKDTQITTVPGVTLTFGNDSYSIKSSSDINAGEVFGAYASGAANPIDEAGLAFDKPGATPPTVGTFYNLTTTKNGTIEIAVVLNASKKYYVLEDGVALDGYNGMTTAAKYYGTYSFPVQANKTYTTFCTGSKLGFYGFTFSTDGTSIASTKANKEVASAEYYNLVGMQLNEPTKGLNILKKTMNDGSVVVEKIYLNN